MSTHKNSPFSHPRFAFSALALALGVTVVQPASALDKIKINQMIFNGQYAASGEIDLNNKSGSFTSVDPFFGAHWTATVQTVFTSSGTWAGTSPMGSFNYQFTIDKNAGDVAAVGTYFDWNGNYGIPVLTVFNCQPTSGCVGTSKPMATLPFKGQSPEFDSAPYALANDRSIDIAPNDTVTWQPSLSGASTGAVCTISQNPTLGSASVTSNCASGNYTAGGSTGNDQFVYQVETAGAVDSGTVTVSIVNIVPPTAQDDVATTAPGQPVIIDVLANDSATAGATLVPSTVTIATAPAKGSVAVDAATGKITYTPTGTACGTDSFTYTVKDDQPQTSSPAKVTVTIGATDAPCATSGVAVSPGDIDPTGNGRVTLSQLLSAGIPNDNGVVEPCVGGCFDYHITGVAVGGNVTLILPLSQPMPPVPKLRKWNGSSWVDYVEDGNNTVSSASKVNGVCPPSGYSNGLQEGNDCIQITISDGGPNDTDGSANGVIDDPLGVGKEFIPAADPPVESTFGGPPFGGGGAIGLVSLFGLAGIGAWKQKRKS